MKKIITDASFEILARQAGLSILNIMENDNVIASGFFIPKAVAAFHDDNISAISYSDTGVFVLFKGSFTYSSDDKYNAYINTERRTNREILFQSKNAAAQFVLGDKGRTNHWV